MAMLHHHSIQTFKWATLTQRLGNFEYTISVYLRCHSRRSTLRCLCYGQRHNNLRCCPACQHCSTLRCLWYRQHHNSLHCPACQHRSILRCLCDHLCATWVTRYHTSVCRQVHCVTKIGTSLRLCHALYPRRSKKQVQTDRPRSNHRNGHCLLLRCTLVGVDLHGTFGHDINE